MYHRAFFSFIAVALGLALQVVAAADGQQIYLQACSSCHQSGGQGVPGVFPPLGEHLADIYTSEGGPRYLASAVIFGLSGPITVAGNAYDGNMPSWFQFEDDEIAAVLNHVMTAFGSAASLADAFEPYAPEEIASVRRGALSPELVHSRRPVVDGAGEEAEPDLPDAGFAMVQVDRIRSVYSSQCAECHGENLDGGLIGGPPLSGAYFEQRWAGRSAASLFQYMQARMPIDRPGALSPQQYVDLVALILHANGHEASQEALPADASVLEQVGILGNDE